MTSIIDNIIIGTTATPIANDGNNVIISKNTEHVNKNARAFTITDYKLLDEDRVHIENHGNMTSIIDNIIMGTSMIPIPMR